MSGDHNQYQKGKSYLDDFECPRCGHCCQADQPTQQEPIAWMHTTGTGHVYFRKKPQDKVFNPQPVYTASPKREWVGLTADEIWKCNKSGSAVEFHICSAHQNVEDFAEAIEAKLKEKNT
jgi:hypothetical protein